MADPYPDAALEERFSQWASVQFEDVHAHVLDLLPPEQARVVDIGAGSGRDALALAVRNYDVVAVEPWDAMREAAAARHGHPNIRWVDDRLPELAKLHEMECRFDFMLVSAVWMHLDPRERRSAMATLASLAETGAAAVMTVRNPPDVARSMCPVPVGEVRSQACANGFEMVREFQLPDALGRTTVTWDVYCIRKM